MKVLSRVWYGMLHQMNLKTCERKWSTNTIYITMNGCMKCMLKKKELGRSLHERSFFFWMQEYTTL